VGRVVKETIEGVGFPLSLAWKGRYAEGVIFRYWRLRGRNRKEC